MVKAIFFDIDGTLKSFQTRKVPVSTKQALEKLKENGIKCFVCTGRPPIFARLLGNDLDFSFDGYVLLNGQYCTDSNWKPFYKHPLDIDTIKGILHFLNEHPEIQCSVMQEKRVFVRYPDERGHEVDDIQLALKEETYQISSTMKPEMDEWLLSQVQNCKSARWNEKSTDLIPYDGGKAIGMQRMLDYFDIKQEDCMAFGDGANDMEMLNFAHIGVSMGNGNEVLKQVADYITDDVDQNGIYKACEYFKLIP